MENSFQEDVVYSHKQAFAQEASIQPNPTPKRRPILLRVFYKVFLGFFADIGKGIFGFFKKYLLLIWHCLRFVWKPNAEEHTIANEKTLSNTKQTFEFILIIITITLFFIKQGFIETTEPLKQLYGNDVDQYLMELVYFFAYSIYFFTVMVVLILLGRLLRVLFKPIESKDVTDKIFINLNNIFYILTTLFAFVQRFDASNHSSILNSFEGDEWRYSFAGYYCVPLGCIVLLFFIRLVMLNKVTFKTGLTYGVVAPCITWFILMFAGMVLMQLFNMI